MRMMWKSWLLLFLAAGFLGAGFLLGGPRSLVAWEPLRPIALESDDWGLAGFVPDKSAWTGLDRQRLDTGRFPDVYWNSTLEDSSVVRRLNDILESHLGRDGLPAVFQPNYVMSSLEYSDEQWVSHDLPAVPAAYERPGMWAAVEAGIAGGTWYPEFHAAWHYDPALRRRDALGSEFAQLVTERGIMLFPGSERARELGAWRPRQVLRDELDHSLRVFQGLFHRPVGSVIAPDYHWEGRNEDLWASRGLVVIQGKREQINPAWGGGSIGRVRKFLGRHWDRLSHPGRTYLERNCRLEPVQSTDPAQVVRQCVEETRRAWLEGQPAVVETHRVNFAHTDPEVVSVGLEAIEQYLTRVCADQDLAPVFLTDHELAQLSRRGVSWCVRGSSIVVRNATGSYKVVAIPSTALELAGAGRDPKRTSSGPVLMLVAPGTHSDLIP